MEREMEAPGFWDDPERSNQKMKELKIRETGESTFIFMKLR